MNTAATTAYIAQNWQLFQTALVVVVGIALPPSANFHKQDWMLYIRENQGYNPAIERLARYLVRRVVLLLPPLSSDTLPSETLAIYLHRSLASYLVSDF